MLGTGEWPAVVKIANHDVLFFVKLKAMHKAGAGKSGGNQARLSQQAGGRVRIGIDGRLAQVAAIVLKDEVRTVVHAHRVATDGGTQTSFAQQCSHLLACRPDPKFSGDVHRVNLGA